MKLVTSQSLADGVKERWLSQYRGIIDGSRPNYGMDKGMIYANLCALDPITPEAVDAAIGNTSWTQIRCDCCEKYVSRAIVFDFDEHTTSLCEPCLADAAKKFRQPLPPPPGDGE